MTKRFDKIRQATRRQVERILALPNESIPKTLFVAISLCLICSVTVSATAVLLKPRQEANQRQDQRRNILAAAELLDPTQDIDTLFEHIEVQIIDLATGDYASAIDAASYEQREAARDPARSVAIAKTEDIAGLKRRARYAPVYLLRSGQEISKIILPVHGYGLWSTMYGYLALEGDANTIAGIKFYAHAETPGLGGEIDNPNWQTQWVGKRLFTEDGDLTFKVRKGRVDPRAADAAYQVDGLAGATLTANGVTNMIRYWIGAQGFGPYLAKLRHNNNTARPKTPAIAIGGLTS